MDIYQNLLSLFLIFCIILLLFRLRIENKKIKQREEIILEKEISIQDDNETLNIKRKNFDKHIKLSLEQVGILTTSSIQKLKNDLKIENFTLYPEIALARENFSPQKIVDKISNINSCAYYKTFKESKLNYYIKNNGPYDPNIYGYVYTMFNLSLPGVVKIGFSDAPQIRAKELTTGEDFRSNAEYAQCKKIFDKYTINKNSIESKLLREYVQNLNLRLKTSLPSPFIVAFFMESHEAFNDECLLHFALKDFNIHRGAGTEFFALSLNETHDVFKSIFPKRAYQYPNFTCN